MMNIPHVFTSLKNRLQAILLIVLTLLMPANLLAQEPYAVLSNGNTVLTFYYDDQMTARGGMDINKNYIQDGEQSPYGTATTAVFDTSFANYKPTSTAYWFMNCSSLTSITGIVNLNTEDVTDMSYMFSGCSSLTSLELSSFNTANVTNMHCMFYSCSSLTSLDLSSFNTANVTIMESMFSNCSGLASLNVSGFNTANTMNMGSMFFGCYGLTNIDLSSFNTANVTNMAAMFSECSSLTSLDLSGFNTANVTSMDEMFYYCSGLTSLDLSGFNTANVTNMYAMFSHCSGLTTLDVSHFNTANVTEMSNMFNECSGLTSLDLSNFNTSNVTSMVGVFLGCPGLTSLDLSSFNTTNVTEMSGMFSGCLSLTTLNLNSFNTANVQFMVGAFYGCTELKTIYAGSEWSTNAVIEGENMFTGCTNLVGGAGTVYDGSHTDYTYAHVDGGTSNPGYFTAAGAEPYTPVTVPLINNEDMESSDNSNFYYRNLQQAYDILPLEFTAGVGVDGSRGIKYEAAARQTNVWDNQVYFHLNQPVSAGTRFKLSFDYRADQDAIIYIAAQSKIWDFIWDWTEPYIYPTTEWQTYTIEGVIAAGVSTDQKPLDTFALSLNEIDGANTYYFDNVKFEAILTDPCPKPTFTTDVNDLSIHSPFGATLHYTVDGSEPTASSATFTTPLSLTQNTVVKAIAVLSGYENSEVATYQFTPGATFDDYGVLTVEGTTTMTGALNAFGGKNVVAEKITAIVWNSTETINNTDLQGINNPNLLVYVNDASLAPGGIQNVVINGTAPEIILTDADGNNNWYCPQPFTAQKISYTRNFQQQTQIGVSRGWETIALPFDVQTIAAEDSRIITPFGDYTSPYNFWLRRLTHNGLQSAQQIEANTPYLISMPNSTEYPEEYKLAGKVTFSAENASVPESNLVIDESADIFFAPTFERMEAQQHIYAINVGEERGGHPEGSVFEQNYREVRPFEAYTKHLTGPSRFITLDDLDEGFATSIEMLKDGKIEELKSKQWYDLNGRRVLRPSKGVFIRNGKQVIFK